MSGSTVRLPRQIPWTVAMEMLITGEPISGRRAYEVGLVGHVVPDGTTLARAREIADRIAANGPLAVRNIKASVLAADALPEGDGLPARARAGHGGHGVEGRQGGAPGLPREAGAELHGRSR